VDRLAGIATGDAYPEQWGEPARAMDFFDIKGDIESLYSMRGDAGKPEFEPAKLPWMHPGASAVIKLKDQVVGWCGSVHPSVLKSFEIKKSVFAFELDLENLLEREIPFTKPISRFPSVRRDLAILLPTEVSYDQVKECITSAAGPLLEKVVVFDVYRDRNLKKGYESLAIGLIFNNVYSTLKDEDIDPVIETVVSELEQRLGTQLRG
jgi:phenylalanyl-tRNA synthetase beta chain